VLPVLIGLANDATRRFRIDGLEPRLCEEARAVMAASLTLVHNQLEKHRAPAPAAQLQVSACCSDS